MRACEIAWRSLFMYARKLSRSRHRLTIRTSPSPDEAFHTCRSMKPSTSSTRCERERNALISSSTSIGSMRSRDTDMYMTGSLGLKAGQLSPALRLLPSRQARGRVTSPPRALPFDDRATSRAVGAVKHNKCVATLACIPAFDTHPTRGAPMSHPNSDSTTQREDPREAGAQPPYEAQEQELPGSEAAMTPKADHGE